MKYEIKALLGMYHRQVFDIIHLWDSSLVTVDKKSRNGKEVKGSKQGKKVGGAEGKETVQALLKYIMLCLDIPCTFMVWLEKGARSDPNLLILL